MKHLFQCFAAFIVEVSQKHTWPLAGPSPGCYSGVMKTMAATSFSGTLNGYFSLGACRAVLR